MSPKRSHILKQTAAKSSRFISVYPTFYCKPRIKGLICKSITVSFRIKLTLKLTVNNVKHYTQGLMQRFWKGGALYVGHHGWPAKKRLGFRWSKKAEITLETISFGQNISISIFKFSSFLSIKSYQFFKIYYCVDKEIEKKLIQ